MSPRRPLVGARRDQRRRADGDPRARDRRRGGQRTWPSHAARAVPAAAEGRRRRGARERAAFGGPSDQRERVDRPGRPPDPPGPRHLHDGRAPRTGPLAAGAANGRRARRPRRTRDGRPPHAGHRRPPHVPPEDRPGAAVRHAPRAGEPARTGGYLQLKGDQRVDAAALALFCDAWWPAALGPIDTLAFNPTIDLTFHIRAELPPEGLDPQPILLDVTTAASMDGLVTKMPGSTPPTARCSPSPASWRSPSPPRTARR